MESGFSSSAWEPWGAGGCPPVRLVRHGCVGAPVAVLAATSPKGCRAGSSQSKLVDVLPAVDALVLACPLTDETRLLIGAPQLAALKPGAVLVNIARGGVIDEEAMIRGLSSGRIKGAALDVFAAEPLPPKAPYGPFPT